MVEVRTDSMTVIPMGVLVLVNWTGGLERASGMKFDIHGMFRDVV